MQDEKLAVTQDSPTVEGLLQAMNELKVNTVSKEDYDKIMADNQKLIKDITNNRAVVTPTTKVDTREDIMRRCEERTNNLGNGSSYESVKALTENYRDMVKLGMDVSTVDEDVVIQLESYVAKADGSPDYFKALMEANIKAK